MSEIDDPEVATLVECYRLLKPFDFLTQNRMLNWLRARFDDDEHQRNERDKAAAAAAAAEKS